MNHSDVGARYTSLRAELASEYDNAVWNSERIDRLTEELSMLERLMAASVRIAHEHFAGAVSGLADRAGFEPAEGC